MVQDSRCRYRGVPVHLKSNLITRGNKEAEVAKNIRKREVAIDQLMAHVRDYDRSENPNDKSVNRRWRF